MPEAVACPRHRGTQTRLRCTRCDKAICPECLTPAATGFICPDCAKADRDSAPKVKRVNGSRPTPVTTVLLVLIGLAALATALQGGMNLSGGVFAGSTELHRRFGMFAPLVAFGEWYRIFTSEFLHYGPFHLAMNAYGLVLLGPPIEERLGSARFVILFLAASAGASAGSAILEPFGLAAGMSGFLFGCLGAGVLLERRRGVRGLMQSQVGIWLAMGLLMTFAIPGLSVGGHLGGLIAGAAASAPMFALDRAEVRIQGITAAIAIAIASTAIAIVASHAAIS